MRKRSERRACDKVKHQGNPLRTHLILPIQEAYQLDLARRTVTIGPSRYSVLGLTLSYSLTSLTSLASLTPGTPVTGASDLCLSATVSLQAHSERCLSEAARQKNLRLYP